MKIKFVVNEKRVFDEGHLTHMCAYGSFSPGRGKLAKCGVFLFKIFEAFL